MKTKTEFNRVCGIVSPKTPMKMPAEHTQSNQNMLLFFFLSFSGFISPCVLRPQKLFFGFGCGAGFGRPLLKKLL